MASVMSGEKGNTKTQIKSVLETVAADSLRRSPRKNTQPVVMEEPILDDSEFVSSSEEEQKQQQQSMSKSSSTTPRKRLARSARTPARSKMVSVRKKKKQAAAATSDSSCYGSDGDDKKAPKKRSAVRRHREGIIADSDDASVRESSLRNSSPSRRLNQSRRRRSIREDDESSDYHSSHSDKKPSRKQAYRKKSARKVEIRSSSSESDTSDSNPAPVRKSSRRQTPTRKVATQRESSGDDYEEDSVTGLRIGAADSDDDFDPNDDGASETGEADEMIFDDEELSASKVASTPKKKKQVLVVRDDDKIGSADSSGDEELLTRSQERSRRNQGQATMPRGALDSDGDVEEKEEDDDQELTDCICPSVFDVITEEKLPDKHVCFVSPDGKSRQCFALETLRKISLASSNYSTRTDNAGRHHQNFLQPPHFRTPMSDDLLDQIASRFGRDALNINGDYYKRKTELPPREWDTHTIVPSLVDSEERFTEQLDRYVRSTMGHQDIYACPICYIAAHAQLDSNNDADDDTGHDFVTEFAWDPMGVIGHLDNDKFQVASAFCYKRVARLKVHLREDHGVDTKRIQGNEAYARYKIRGQDGLLQRYLRKQANGKWTARQGEMMRYWQFGNNSNFLLLLSLVSQAEDCRQVLKDGSQDDEEVDSSLAFLQPALDFFSGFERNVAAIWETVASPFGASTKEEIADFVADDDQEEEEPNHMMLHSALRMQDELAEFDKSQSINEQIVERYEQLDREQRRSSNGNDYEEEESESSEANDEQEREESEVEDQDDDVGPDDQAPIVDTAAAGTPKITPAKRNRARSESASSDEDKKLYLSKSRRKRIFVVDSDDDE